MSFKAIAWAAQVEVGRGSAKCVLLALAGYADEHGRGARPCIGTLARKSDFSPRTVDRALALLEQRGLIAGMRRHRKPTVWTLALAHEGARVAAPDRRPAGVTRQPPPARRPPRPRPLASPDLHATVADESAVPDRQDGVPCTPLWRATSAKVACHTVQNQIQESDSLPTLPQAGGDRQTASPDSSSSSTPPAAVAPSASPRAAGTNPRALGSNPRALGTNPRATGASFHRASAFKRLPHADRAEFHLWWPLYPVHEGERATEAAWARACHRLRAEGFDASWITSNTRHLLPLFPADRALIRSPAKFLDGGHYDDDPEQLRARKDAEARLTRQAGGTSWRLSPPAGVRAEARP